MNLFRRAQNRSYAAIILSLGAHALFLYWESPLKRPKVNNEVKPKPVEVRLVTRRPRLQEPLSKPKARSIATEKQGRLKSAHEMKSSHPTPAAASEDSGAVQDNSGTYGKLLPSGRDFGAIEGQARSAQGAGAEPHHYIGGAYQNIMIDSNILVGVFDIPLFIRQEIAAGSAFLSITVLDEKGFKLEVLSGNPFLRAVIWESLQKSVTLNALRSLAKNMDETHLAIHLSFARTKASLPHGKRYEETIAVDKGVVRIHFNLNDDKLFGPPQGGIPLPDYDAKLAIRVDRLRGQELARSPAFQKVLRNRTL